jgi:hypothetical protein
MKLKVAIAGFLLGFGLSMWWSFNSQQYQLRLTERTARQADQVHSVGDLTRND